MLKRKTEIALKKLANMKENDLCDLETTNFAIETIQELYKEFEKSLEVIKNLNNVIADSLKETAEMQDRIDELEVLVFSDRYQSNETGGEKTDGSKG